MAKIEIKITSKKRAGVKFSSQSKINAGAITHKAIVGTTKGLPKYSSKDGRHVVYK